MLKEDELAAGSCDWRAECHKAAMATAKTVALATRARVLARSGLSPTRHAAAAAPALTAGEQAVGRTQAPRHRYIANEHTK